MIKRIISLSILTAALSGCGIYRMDIQQGNLITPEELAQVRPGMSQAQVQDVLGTPLLADDFRQDRWDYIFYLKEGSGTLKRSGVAILFNQAGVVTDIRRDPGTTG